MLSLKKVKYLNLFFAVILVAGLVSGFLMHGSDNGQHAKAADNTVVMPGSGCSQPSFVTVTGFSADQASGVVPLTVTFTAQVWGFNPPFYYNWDFNGDGIWDEQGVSNGAGSCTNYVNTHTFYESGPQKAVFALSDYYGYATAGNTRSVAVSVEAPLNGNLKVNVYPKDVGEANFTITAFDGTQRGETVGQGDLEGDHLTKTIENLPKGTYSLVFSNVDGYITPEPDMISVNDDLANYDPAPKGRKVYVESGTTSTIDVTYRKNSNLHLRAQSQAETLHFTPSERVAQPQWQLRKASAGISVDKTNWYRSSSDVLVISETVPLLEITKSDSKGFIGLGETNDYVISFLAAGTEGSIYSAQLVDQLSAVPSLNVSYLSFSDTNFELCFDNNGVEECAPINASISSEGKRIVFALSDLVAGIKYSIHVKVKVDNYTPSNTRVVNGVSLDVAGTIATASDEDVLITPFLQEDFGGDIFANGNIDLGEPSSGDYNARYIVAANGKIKQAITQDGWRIEEYEMDAGSSSNLSSSDCNKSGSACNIMQENIKKLLKSGEEKVGGLDNIDFTYLPKIPEGKAWVYDSGDLNIFSSSGNVNMSGKGTIVVKNGNLNIKSNLVYDSGTSGSITGFIVLNGNVVIDPLVSEVNGIFYIPNGKYITPSNSTGDDKQLINKGLFVAKDFDLGRTYTGLKTSQTNFSTAYGDIVPNDRINQYDSVGFDAFCKIATGDSDAVGVCTSSPYGWGPYSCWNGSGFQECGGSASFKSGACEAVSCTAKKKPSDIFRYDARVLFNTPPGFGGKFLKNLN